ncbi:EexN family lipoprotein [Bartonella schoenbuchensis]|uniref:Vbh6 protein n=1 Tax=Bartonella schoenbuchensis (strain DSM 13525 / NCTC 13165 / R1) TaxID=687861 RepID=E6Z0Q4_BARSR
MKKIIMTTLLLCTGLIIAGCEKTYSVEEFKKNKELRGEWDARCGFSGQSKNCQNVRLASDQLRRERYGSYARELLGDTKKERKAE